ncbi:MAG: threonine/serine exporter family protein [Eubacterium sp.]
MEENEIFSLSLDIGQAIIKSGGEIHRAKDTIKRINYAYGNKCVIFAVPSLIIAQSDRNIEIRRIEGEDTDLSELSRLNALSRRLCNEENEEINITRKKVYPKIFEMLAVCSATGAFCLFFGGSIIDALFSAMIGLVINSLDKRKGTLPLFSSNLIESAIAGILSFLPLKIGIHTHPDKIIIGTIMLLVPGLTVVNAMMDMMNGDLIAGLIELFKAIMSALAIALGFAGAVILFVKL